MSYVRKVVDDVYYVGVDDHRITLFENMHPVPKGVSYNSYLLMDEKTVLFDTVDWCYCRQFLENITTVLQGRTLDYVVVHHMEPDHSASLEEVLLRYPECKVIATEKAYMLMNQFGYDSGDRFEQVKEGDKRNFGKHTVTFIEAPMVHWPEVMVTFDETNGILFSADAFGTFGALNGKLFNDEMDFDRDWLDDARRYYTNIVGKYGPFVQTLLKKASELPIKMICALHGPVWRSNLDYFIDKYDKWSRYEPEVNGVMIAYASMYGNTESTALELATILCDKGLTNVAVHDVSSTDGSELIADSFKYSHLVFASATYNLNIYPLMHDYLEHMKLLNLQKRTVAIIENGSWASKSGILMKEFLDGMKEMTILPDILSINSTINEAKRSELIELADAIIESVKAREKAKA
ncbi:MAG: FprA family A-type flavoprotein [Clostridiaceae bacterium]